MSSATTTPAGGVVPMTRRVMNLAHIATQNARRLPAHPAFIWGEKALDWAEIDAQVSALAAGLKARGIGKGDRLLVHSKNCDAMFVSMFATFRLGAVWVPTNFRLLPDEVAYLATASGARRAGRRANSPRTGNTMRSVASAGRSPARRRRSRSCRPTPPVRWSS